MKVLTIIDIQNMSIREIYEKYGHGYRLEGFGDVVRNISPVICTKTGGVVGEIIHLKSTPTGTAPYTVRFYKDTTLLATFTNVLSGTTKIYDYTLVSGDVGSRVFKAINSDSCATGILSCIEQCAVTVTAACAIPTCNFVVE